MYNKGISKRPRKGRATSIQETPHISVSWKLGWENHLKVAYDKKSSLHVFVGANLLNVKEINDTLDNYK
jgi:hypothetical protein